MNHCAIICYYDGICLSYTDLYFEAHSVKVNVTHNITEVSYSRNLYRKKD